MAGGGQQIHAVRLQVNRHDPRRLRRIDEQKRIGASAKLGNGGDWLDGAEDVRSMDQCHQTRGWTQRLSNPLDRVQPVWAAVYHAKINGACLR